jgi:nucleoside phosphorylase
MASAKASDRAGARVAVVAALREELQGLESQFEAAADLGPAAPGCLGGRLRGCEVVLCRTGIGAARARERTAALLASARFDALLAIGFAGGLCADLENGDLVVADEVVAPPPPLGEGPASFRSDLRLLETADAALAGRLGVRRGRLLTVSTVLRRSAQKRRAGEDHGADAVDMESAGVARAARDAGVPALFARAILDGLQLDLPLDFNRSATPDGRLRVGATFAALARRPQAVFSLIGLGRRARRARERLTELALRFLESFESAEALR